jgi:effector-binding domain-containing protein
MKKAKWILGVVILATLTWYFFLKPEHYQITFTTSQPPGVVYQHILDWPIYGKKDSLNIQMTSAKRYSEVQEEVSIHDSLFHYNWDFIRINDSLTRVTAHISDVQHPWLQKLQVPFIKNAFVNRSILNVKNVGEQLVKKQENFKVAKITDTVFPSTYCAYIKVSSELKLKAKNMLSNISVIMNYIKDNEIPLNGDPFLEVTHWDQEHDRIDFNFCFPIHIKDSLPYHPEILFKETLPLHALKAVYHGNYKISDNAWYYLLDYAERNHLEIEDTPIEIYLNDPHEGGNSLEWEAHILLPLKEKK